ncbi:MAG: hypothetical protein F6J93_25490 [Oscillatoria sp. SIO1A7]|nr:hypothetical protein [Oscillatoria sp. SIO1A7]
MSPLQNLSDKLLLEQIISQIFIRKQISRLDQQVLMSALLARNSISDQDQSQLNRVFDGIQRGLIRVVE